MRQNFHGHELMLQYATHYSLGCAGEPPMIYRQATPWHIYLVQQASGASLISTGEDS